MSQRQWGKWSLSNTEQRSLDFPAYGEKHQPYWIRLFPKDATFEQYTAWLGHWVEHITEKTWITPQDLYDFVLAAQAVREQA